MQLGFRSYFPASSWNPKIRDYQCKMHLGANMLDFGLLLGPQNGPQTRIKFDTNKTPPSRQSCSRLGTISGRFGTHVRFMFVDFPCAFTTMFECQRFSPNIPSRAILDQSEADFGQTWGPTRAPKRIPKRYPKWVPKLDPKWEPKKKPK